MTAWTDQASATAVGCIFGIPVGFAILFAASDWFVEKLTLRKASRARARHESGERDRKRKWKNERDAYDEGVRDGMIEASGYTNKDAEE